MRRGWVSPGQDGAAVLCKDAAVIGQARGRAPGPRAWLWIRLRGR